MPTLSTTAVIRRQTARALFAVLLCAGCVGPLNWSKHSGSCSVPVDACADCESPAYAPCGDCASPTCDHCGGCGYGCGLLLTVGGTVAGVVEPIVCWPCDKCRHIVNFCAPDGYAGPPPLPGPGRFHPVPTHPVFQPNPDPPEYSAQ